MKDILIIHHSPCSDGSVAAAIVSNVMSFYDCKSINVMGTTYGKYEFLLVDKVLTLKSYGKSYNIDKNTEIVVVDFSFSRDELIDVSQHCSTILVLDHHKTAQENLAGEFPDNCEVVFDMNRSGAMLAWDEFAIGKRRRDCSTLAETRYSRFVQLVGMRDLWKHKGTVDQQDAEALQLALNSRDDKFDAKKLEKYINDGPEFDKLLAEGHMLLKFFDSQLKSAQRNAIITFLGEENNSPIKTVAVCNASYDMASELGNRLCEAGNNFAVLWSLGNTGEVSASIRSIGEHDCTVIAGHFGGGGHKNAAGFRATLYEFLDYFKLIYLIKF